MKKIWTIAKFGWKVVSVIWAIVKKQLPDLSAGAGENVENIRRDLRKGRDTWQNRM